MTPWWERALREHESDHGPSGSAWNVSAILDRLRKASQPQAPSGEPVEMGWCDLCGAFHAAEDGHLR